MSVLNDFDLPFDGQGQRVLELVREAMDLRYGEAGDPDGTIRDAPQETPQEIQHLLVRVRSRSDRVDELLSRATLAKGRARRVQDEAAWAAEVRMLDATKEHSSKRVEFSAAREREAEAKLDSIQERRVAHQAARMVSVTVDAYEVINQIHWSLDAIRKDLRASLHALQFESSLER